MILRHFFRRNNHGIIYESPRDALFVSNRRDHRRRRVFVLLYEAYRPSNLPFPHSAYEKFSLANKDSAECNSDFRVEKRVIPLLLDALRVPPVRNGTICDGVEGLCIGWLHGHMFKTLPTKGRYTNTQSLTIKLQ